MAITGVGADWYEPLKWLAQHESNYNPYAVNKKSGAAGLMQMLPSTFRAYAARGMKDIFNPVHNLVAAINYIKKRYKHPTVAISNWYKRGGY